jgi:anaerobic nitric oxide reductase transcription regulator
MQYDWPGNVRELQHVLMRAALRAAASAEGKVAVIELKHLGSDFVADSVVESGSITPVISTENKSFNEILSDFQRQLITQAMEDNDHVWAKAARQLQLDRGNLYRQAKRLGLT